MLYVSIGSNINLYLFLLHIKCKTGKEKLGFSEAEVCIFTEDDGTEVEEDVFSEFSPSTIFVMMPKEVPFLPDTAADEIEDTTETIPEGVVLNSTL